MAIRVLLVDPKIAFIVGIKQALEETGEFLVTLSANGAGAEDAFNRAQYDVVIIDFELPDIDVQGLIGRMRIMQSTLPVILTPRTEDQVARVPLLNVQGSIRKPYTARDLIPCIRDVLSRSSTPPSVRPQRERFVPPETSPSLRHLERPAQGRSGPSPTELLDEVEKKKLSGQTPAPPSRPTPPPRSARVVRRDSTKPITPDSTEPLSPDQLERPVTPPSRPKSRRPSGTVRLYDETGSVDQLPPDALTRDTSDRTQPASSTQALDDLMDQHGWIDRSSSPVATRPLPPRGDEPPRQPDDTPAVPDYDSPAVRQFLATGDTDPAAADFGAVLDAVAQTPPGPRSPEDQAFHDLVESLRVPEDSSAGAVSLEDLLTAIAEDQARQMTLSGGQSVTSGSALDYVLDAIRRAPAPEASGAAPPDFDDATIGDVMGELFDPAFEQVLAALAGEEIPPEDPAAAEGRADHPELREDDRYAAEDLELSEDEPAWLAGYEGRDIEPPESLPESYPAGPLIAEPPIEAGDSSRYPATAALSAVTQGDESDTTSLDQLLQEIERQLPPARPRQPRLKPLPSWGRVPGQADQLSAIFDKLEGLVPAPSTPPPAEEPPVEAEAEHFSPGAAPVSFGEMPPVTGDTRPSEAFLEALGDVPVQEIDTRPYGPSIPALESEPSWDEPAVPAEDLDRLPVEDRAPAAKYAESPAFEEQAGPDEETILPVAMAELLEGTGLPDDADMQELLAALEAGVGPLPEDESAPTGLGETGEVGEFEEFEEFEEFGEFREPGELGEVEEFGETGEAAPPVQADQTDQTDQTDETDITAVFYSAVRQTPDYTYQPPAAPDQVPAAGEAEYEPGYAPEDLAEAGYAPETASAPQDAYAAETESWADAGPPVDDEGLVAMSAESAARLLEGDMTSEPGSAQAEEELVARIAVQLTQFSLESLAQATLLSRPGRRLAEAGNLPPAAMNRLFDLVDQAWSSDRPPTGSLMRYIALPEAGDFLLYSVLVEDDMVLSMVFHSRTSMRTIRKQARRLSEALAYVPETHDAAPVAPPAAAPPEPATEPDPAATLPSRPTDLRPPEGLYEAVQASLEMATAPAAESELAVAPPVRPAPPDVPYTAYTCLWLPDDPHRELGGEFARELSAWIQEIAAHNAWEIDALHVRSDHVELTLGIPQKTSPDEALDHLMDDTAQRGAAYYPDLVEDPARLWSDAYYVTTPPRALSERDIARFIDYCQAARQQ